MDLVDNPLRRSQIGPKNIISDRLEPFPIYHVNSISTDAEPVSIDYDQFQNEDNVENDRYKFTKIRKDLYPLHHDTHQLDSDDLYRTPLQRKFYYFFEEPRSKWAQLYSFVSLLCVLITITVICIDSLPTVFIIKQVNVRICITAMTTTGYGDDLPITLLGRFLATLTTISGLLVIALTSSIIGINSDLEWSKYLRRESRVNFYAMWKAIDDANVEKLSSKEQTAKADLLEFQNGILVDLIEEIQDRFNEIDPPMYKFKYDNLRVEYNQTIGKLSQLELEMKEYENLGNLDDYERLDIIKNDE
ncbi:14955_t:CDS:2 [Funneliformis caledonium]|uniref:14955_t:CDS:1 n=1 Tax=Funneliformis caledonium TaxID=1117310 RepID=A0A9N9FA23_9GLOM|nr:14955_t:CDS:2 [Funneliformis caledonium]